MQPSEQSDTSQAPVKPRPNGATAAAAPTPGDEQNAALADTAGENIQPEQDTDAPPETLRRDPNVFASAVWLMQRSPRHRHLFISDLEWALLPPMALKQFRLFHKNGMPLAFATWAFVSDEVEARLKEGQMRLKPDEWKSGENCWLVDVVTPRGTEQAILKTLKQDALSGFMVKYLGSDPEIRTQKEFKDQ